MTQYTSFNPTSKAIVVAEREAYRAEQRKKRHIERACFWTRPFGHVYEVVDRVGLVLFLRCESCGKTKVDLPR